MKLLLSLTKLFLKIFSSVMTTMYKIITYPFFISDRNYFCKSSIEKGYCDWYNKSHCEYKDRCKLYKRSE